MQRWFALAVVLALLFFVRSILSPFVLAAIAAYGLSPVVYGLAERLKIRHRFAAALVYLAMIVVIGGAIALIEPRLVAESRGLADNAPEITRQLFFQIFGTDRIEFFGNIMRAEEVLVRGQEALAEYLGRPQDALHLALSAVEGLGHLLLFLIVSFYFIVDSGAIGEFCLRLVPPEHRVRVALVGERVHAQLGRYLRGQVYLVVLMSTVTYVMLQFVFNLRFALPVAILTGVLEVLPIIGPVLATVIAASIALTTQGLVPMGWIIVAYTILRQVEDQLVMPQVVGRAVHLHPVVTLFAVLAGGAIAGLLGMLLAIPVAAAAKVVLDEWLREIEGTPPPAPAPASDPRLTVRPVKTSAPADD